MSEYTAIFDARGGHYNLANRRFPGARAQEARALLDHLALRDRPGPWLDLAAGGGYLAERARAEGIGATAFACDASLPFLAGIRQGALRTVAQYESLPFADGSFTATGCLAALHHAENVHRIVAEMLRVTAPEGRAAVGDVAPGSAPAEFLNRFVDRHTETGHHGRFGSAKSLLDAFVDAGGKRPRAQETEIAWIFPSEAAALEFSRELFGLRPDTSDPAIAAELRALGLTESDGQTLLPWRMVFVSAAR